MFHMPYEEYLDKVRGGWFGKCLGGAAGAPFEGFKRVIEVEGFEATIDPSLPNDDLDLQILWLDLLQRKGLLIDSADLAEAWRERCAYSMSEYGYFMKNFERGILPPVSGSFNNSFFAAGNGCPIRSEIWGFLFPGNPALASRYAHMDGSLDHAGESIYIEQFYAALESLAFFDDDIMALIAAAAPYLPADSRAASCVRDMSRARARFPDAPLRARELALRNYGHNDFTYSLTNFSFVLIGLLYGEGDIDRTIDTALMCGYDTDCTCATAAAILCETIGFSKIDDRLKKLCGDSFVLGIDVKRKDNTIAALAEEVCLLGIEAAGSLNAECLISGAPASAKAALSAVPKPGPRLRIEYEGAPAIGADDEMAFDLVVSNEGGAPFAGKAVFSGLPEGWAILVKECTVLLDSGDALRLPNRLYTRPGLGSIRNTNILSAWLLDEGGGRIACADFGVAGASVWRLAGPFFEALDKADDEPRYPAPHPAGCVLPTLECMVNNVAFLDKAYLDETRLVEAIEASEPILLNAYEDLLPIDSAIPYAGQACFYLSQRILSATEREVWLVIGNNDAYRIWLNGAEAQAKDENRLWTPYNNFTLVRLLKGENRLVIKLLRRSGELKFSIGFRLYEGKHWHQKRWITDLSSLL
jgi:ADP-ribosylglycohydrolase